MQPKFEFKIETHTITLDDFEVNHLVVLLKEEIARGMVIQQRMHANNQRDTIEFGLVLASIKRSRAALKKLTALTAAEGRG